ncbi:MAG: elongation factor 1-beta [Candidatus Altarchaeaceae archaeon]
MYDTVAKIRVMPKDINVNLEEINEKIKEILNKFENSKFHSSEIKPIAFGLKALEVTLLITEEKSELDKIEEEILKIEGVGNIDEIDIHLISNL